MTERGQTFLGRVIDTIPLSPEALASNDPEEVIFSNLDFVDWAQQKAYLLVGEFPIESLMVGSTDYYLGEILNGGHGQFIWNSGWNELTNILVDAGLTAFGRDGYLEIYREMVETVKADSLLLSNIVERKIEFGAACEHFSKLDDRFYALGCEWASGTNGEYQSYDHLRFLMANWLRALPIVRPVPDEQREALLEDWKKRNLLLDARSEKDREATKAQRAA
ncbi:MAG TPA: hypothetical protein VMJ31_04100, partial [Methylocystis sp.]|nr:hypothetical protein [Methylocystis sp.]